MLDPLPSQADVTRLRAGDIQNAARHHRRALSALRAVTVAELPDATMQKLLKHFAEGLDGLEAELERRGLDASDLDAA